MQPSSDPLSHWGNTTSAAGPEVLTEGSFRAPAPAVIGDEGAGLGTGRSLLVLLTILAVGLFLRFHDLSSQSLWHDETFSWRMTQYPWGEITRRTAEDVHPPLYYWILKGWVGFFGDSALAMRSLSAVLDSVNLGVLYWFCIRIYGTDVEGRTVGLLAAGAVALSPFHLAHAREVRMYPLGGLLAIASSGTLWLALQGRGSPTRAWAGFVLLSIGLVYTHHFGLLTVAAQGLFVLAVLAYRAVRGQDPGRLSGLVRGAVVSFAVIGLAYAPWVPVLQAQRGGVLQGYWIIPFGRSAISAAVEQLFSGDLRVVTASTGGLAPLALGVLLAAALARGRLADLYAVLLAAAPFAMAAAVSVAQGRNIIVGRYLHFSAPFVFVAGARLVTWLPDRSARLAVVAVVAVNLAGQDWAAWRGADAAHRPGVQAAVARLAAGYQPGEPVIALDPSGFLAARYYLRHDHRIRPYLLIPDGADPWGQDRKNQGGAVLSEADCLHAGQLHGLTAGRVWLITTDSGGSEWKNVSVGWSWRRMGDFDDAAPYRGRTYLYVADLGSR
jgi:mannosyltransferase